MNKSHRAMRIRRQSRVPGGIRRHHRQQIITMQLIKLKGDEKDED